MVATFFGLFLVGCLDAPDYRETLKPVDAIHVTVKQKGDSFSTQLKVHPSDSATLKAKVVPEKYQDDLTYEWFFSDGKKDSLLIRNESYTFYPTIEETIIPNKLIATDKDGNKEALNFSIIVNSLPILSNITTPKNGDTLYGSFESAFLFEWYSYDVDIDNGDSLFHTLDIDGKLFDVGALLQVKQSGFTPGEHKFRVIVRDLYGDTDTLAYKSFFVIDTLEAK